MAWWKTKSWVYVVGGSLLAMLGAFGMIGAYAYDSVTPHNSPSYEPSLLPGLTAMCGLLGVLPGFILIYLGMRARGKSQSLVEFSSWVRTYRRIGLTDLAHKLGKSEMETERILADAIDKQLVYGFIDRQTNEFVAWESSLTQVMVPQCPNCNAAIGRLYLAGETILCPYCKSVIPPSAAQRA